MHETHSWRPTGYTKCTPSEISADSCAVLRFSSLPALQVQQSHVIAPLNIPH
ncbi:hypothetical protein CEV32_0074 [Brucella rhizosphaerae]|uniref:Uncharacterized protein n=1 Tax=Brucella rhizosphaerae TaxID=571254 RepID=A0A256FGU8_9HYPH|nr:hypothetical protein CEV32_0074 [Brucella rhizosphaerae]